ncbi:hypothetical protein EI77_02073 [Prosthecobacter fusiformis]|uniref:Uncharacterized protein n=1 Tax=Prosthecobacter fusiformis TaxID=48464 RepID=A0A4R7S192_9BACT|nr:hypothetical protein EI77_02073 [Prosthecobacter fusiformis]
MGKNFVFFPIPIGNAPTSILHLQEIPLASPYRSRTLAGHVA